MNQSNPLLGLKNVNDNTTIPFQAIKTEHFGPALDATMASAKTALQELADAKDAPTFANTIEGIEFHKEDLDRVSAIFFNLVSADTNDKMQELAKDYSPKLAELSNDLLLNEKIFQRVKAVWDSRANLKLDREQNQLLEKTYKAFRRNGALLNAEQKEKLREIDRELAKLGHEFSDNVLKATNEYVLFVGDDSSLKKLPANALEEAKALATAKGRPEAWAFTLHYPSMGPFLQYCSSEALRREIWLASNTKGMKAPHDNQQITRKIASLRHSRAQLLGFSSHAAYVLEERMAGSAEKVLSFLDNLLEHSYPAALRDLEDLRAEKRLDTGSEEFNSWDSGYYSEILKQKKFSFSEEELRPYFSLDKVIEGVFTHAQKLYGLRFEEDSSIPVYHADVRAYRAKNEKGEFVGFFYADFFPRESKRSGAWMTNFLEQGTWAGQVLRPHVAIVCNFTKPTASMPSLLTFDEVKTLFHEFGHALHSLLTKCRYASLSGTNVYWDFVELPSQIMENWANEREGLHLFARHYQTGAVIPEELIDKIKISSTFQAGLMSVRQISFGILDMAWHKGDPKVDSIEGFEKTAIGKAQLLPKVPGTAISTAFSHVFAGGYSAGYYSYKWAEVLDADAFEFFKEKGIFSREVADKFRIEILERGGSEHPMDLYKKFRGREPDPKALLRRDGLVA